MPRPLNTDGVTLRWIFRGFGHLLVLLLLFATQGSAQTFQNLVNFDSSNGAEPVSPLLQAADGNLYGTTPIGGKFNSDCSGTCGTAYQITPNGPLTSLYDFCSDTGCADGFAPLAGFALTLNGTLYGTASQGGEATGRAGTLFKISNSGINTLFDFPDPSLPATALIQSINGDLYGTTSLGGTFAYGSVFKFIPGTGVTTIYSFNKTDGESPSSLVLGSDGNFYGTTTAGGSGTGCNQTGCGTVFRLTPRGVLTVLHDFCTGKCRDGSAPASLIRALDGNLYGVTLQGGRGPSDGTLFRISLSGTLKTLHSFCSLTNCTDGLAPQQIIQASDGNLYGVAAGGGDLNCDPQLGGGCGTVFEFSSTSVFTTLHTFESTDGAFAYGLTQDTNGAFYGVTSNGGTGTTCSLGCGTIFSLNTGLGSFVSFVFPAAKIGETVGIIGQGFIGTTGVSLNSTTMTFTVVSDTYIEATVPSSATNGYVTVTTPGGTLKSNVPLTVIR